MNIIDEIQKWSNKGYFIEYMIVDQIENGYEAAVKAKNIPPITYTIDILRKIDGELLFQESFNELEKGLLKAIKYLEDEISVK